MTLLSQLMTHDDLTAFFVTYEVGEVKALFDHTRLLRNGRVFGQGATAEMVAETQILPNDGQRSYDPRLFIG